ncbi:MAG: ABC transporter permease [Sphingomonadales bacterium]
MISKIVNVFKKEKLDLLRDKRTVFASLSFALFGPLLLVLMLNYIANMAEDETKPRLAVLGGEYAPNLIKHLGGDGIEITNLNDETEIDILLKDFDALLKINEEFGNNLQKGKFTSVELFLDQGKIEPLKRARQVHRSIAIYGVAIGDSRLIALGVPPSFRTPFVIETRDVSVAGAQAKQMSFMILFYFMMAPFFSSMSVSIDITAGERERKSLQTLLAQPVTTGSLILGKWALAAGFGMLGTTISVIAGMFALGSSPIEVLGMRIYMDFSIQLQLLVILFPLCWLVAGMQILVALVAKSYKEANAYLGLFTILPALIGGAVMIKGDNIDGILSFSPILSHFQLAHELLMEGHGDWISIGLASLITIVLGALSLFLAAKKLGTEKILSGA